jgi:hypothetical protein
MRPCASSTAIADALVESKESVLCANSRGYLHLYPQTLLQSEKTKRSLSFDAIMALDGVIVLRESIKPRSSPRPNSTTLSGLVVVDVEDATPLSRHRYQPLVPLADAQLQE